jgi:hypothetical protein
MTIYDFVMSGVGPVYGTAIITVTALYAGMFVNAAWELMRLCRTGRADLPKRTYSRTLIRFFTACNDIVKLVVIGKFTLTLFGFIMVIEGFRQDNKDASLSGMSMAVISSLCYVPAVVISSVWMLLLRCTTAARQDIQEFLTRPLPPPPPEEPIVVLESEENVPAKQEG